MQTKPVPPPRSVPRRVEMECAEIERPEGRHVGRRRRSRRRCERTWFSAAGIGARMVVAAVWLDTAYAAAGRRWVAARSDDRGEITSTVAMIGVLVVGALAAGAIVAARMKAHALAVPGPGG